MPDLDLDAIKASVDKAHQEIGEIAEQGVTRRWRMHIPAQPDRDSDLIISRALTGVDALLAEVKRLHAKLARDHDELRDKRTDLLNIRGILKPADRIEPTVPMPLGHMVAPAVEWLADEVKRLRAFEQQVLEPVKAEVTITPTMAAHVLFHFGEGGYEAGGFTSNLIGLITRADPQRRALLGLSFPGYVAAVTLADRTTDGIAVLTKIAGRVA